MIYPTLLTLVWFLAVTIAVLVERGKRGWFCGVWSFMLFFLGIIVTCIAWLGYAIWRLLP